MLRKSLRRSVLFALTAFLCFTCACEVDYVSMEGSSELAGALVPPQIAVAIPAPKANVQEPPAQNRANATAPATARFVSDQSETGQVTPPQSDASSGSEDLSTSTNDDLSSQDATGLAANCHVTLNWCVVPRGANRCTCSGCSKAECTSTCNALYCRYCTRC